MANNKLTLAVAINLLTENFKKGTNSVVNGFKSMQVRVTAFVAALGFGTIGLTNFISKLVQTAKETSRVTTMLKNISGGTATYVENQKYLNKMAKDYSLEINSLTENFAKFSASATAGGMALNQQRKIFESVSKSVAAFGLTSQESNGVFLALSQMMSKGKVASQELRLQMGEKLPIAIQAMANAMGVSVAQLDKMLSKGELMANDVLPKFAEQLDKMSPKIDTNNLSASLTNMENAFGDLTDKLGVEAKFKKVVDAVTTAITTAANNISTIVNSLILGIIFFTVHGATKIVASWKAAALQKTDISKKLSAEIIALETNQEAKLRRLQDLRLRHSVTTGARRLKLEEDIAVAEKRNAEAAVLLDRKRAELNRLSNTQISNKAKLLGSLNGVIKGVGRSLKSLWSTFAPAAIITGLASIVMYFKNIYDENKRIKNLFDDYNKNANQTSSSPEIEKLKALQTLYNSQSASVKEQESYKKEIISLLGKEITGNKDINNAIRERIKLLEASARVDYYTQKKIETEDKINSIYAKYGGESKFNRKITAKTRQNKGLLDDLMPWSNNSEIDRDLRELVELRKVIAHSTNAIEQWTKEKVNIEGDKSTTLNVVSTSDELTKLEDKYAKSLAELDIKLRYSLITQDEYNKAKDDLVKSSFVEAKLSKDEAVVRSKYLKNLESQLKKPLFDAQQVEISKIQADYGRSVEALNNQRKNTELTEKQYNSKLLDLINKTVEQIAAMSDLTDAQIEYIQSLQVQAKSLEVKESYSPEKRDTTFDYKKTDRDILSEELEVAKKNYATLKNLASDNLKEFEGELMDMMSNIESMSDALKMAEVIDDVKRLNKEIKQGSYEAAKSIMSGADGMVNSIQQISDAFSSADASGWERIMAIWNALTSTIDSFMSIIELINRITKATEMLTTAQQAQVAMDSALLPIKIANTTTETAVEVNASKAKTNAAMEETASKATSAYANIPFVGIGLAAATIAAMFALIPRFKDGGIVGGGATTGDRMLARVNAGEMILNNTQQSNLWKMLNSQSSVKHTDVNIGGRVRGADIYLALNNYIRSSGKKLG